MKGPGTVSAGARKLHDVLRAAALLGLIVAVAAAAQPLPRVDTAASQPDFLAFRAEMLSAIARRDSAALLAMVDPTVKISFGGDDGIARFSEMWRPDATDSRLWETLGTVLALGGTFTQPDTFTAPYVFAAWPDDVDAFEHAAIVGSTVRVRAAPSLESPPIVSLSYTIVELADRAAVTDEWVAVRLADGRTGFVARRYVRSPLDYRAIFQKAGDGWRLRAFVAGD